MTSEDEAILFSMRLLRELKPAAEIRQIVALSMLLDKPLEEVEQKMNKAHDCFQQAFRRVSFGDIKT